MKKRILEFLILAFCIASLATSFIQGEKKLDEERKRTLIMKDIKIKVDKLWQNLQ